MAVRRLLCKDCAQKLKPIREQHDALIMLCFGSLKLDRAPGEMVIKDGEEVHHLPTPSPCRCDGCNTSLRKGAQVCCYQYWRPRYAPRFEEYEHGWELDFVRDPAYEWIAW